MATNPTLLTQPIAANGAKNVIPNTTSTAGAMSQDQGFPAETALPLGAGGVAPSREDFNGAFNLLSGLMFYAQKGWQFEFDEAQDYYAGCIVRDTLDGKLYEALNDVSASSTHPSTDSTNWKATAIDTSVFANIQLSNLDTSNLSVHVVVDSYYDSATGDWWREYDDGWIEQGGIYTKPDNTYYGTVSLLKPMADTMYSGQLTLFFLTATSEVYYYETIMRTKSTTEFGYYAGTLSSGRQMMWQVCGMGATI